MRKAFILHGTDGHPESNWFMWLKDKLENAGYEVQVPLLPDNHTPNRKTYNDYLFGLGYDLTNSLLIGHSSGAVSVLNLLEDERCPSIDKAVLVGVWYTCEGTVLNPEQFKKLFPKNGFNFELIRSKVNSTLIIHGDDDPYCPLDQAKLIAEKLKSKVSIIKGGGHLGSTRNPDFPELKELLNL